MLAALAASAALAACSPATVHYTAYPGGAPGLTTLPWVRGTSHGLGLVGLIWYWPESWQTQRVEQAKLFAGGKAPNGANTKILWAFLSPRAKRAYKGGPLTVKGERLDAPGKTWQRFVPIGYSGANGAPSFASIIDVPSEGCWRLQLGAPGLHATVVFAAIAG